MLRDITLGQYFPGDTAVHRLDPRTKIVLTFVYIVVLFLARGVFSYLVMLFWLGVLIAVSGIKPRVILKGLRPIVFIVILTGVLNMFYTPGQPVFTVWFLTVTTEGIVTAGFMVLRIVMLITGSFILTYTTSPIMLTEGIESLFSPLKRFGAPVHELAMMMSIALRFIPTLIEETDKIISAQRARGADFDSGSILKKAKALVPILVPLFVSAFRRAEELAVAMESRCYSGGAGRTRLRELRLHKRDFSAFFLAALLSASAITLGVMGL